MLLLRAFVTGVVVAFGMLVVVVIGNSLRLSDAVVLAMLAAPLALLAGASLSGPSAAGWPARVVNGGVGALLSAAAAITAVFNLRGRTDWFDYPGDQGGELFLMALACLAAVPGGAAAAASRADHGFGLALGFSVGATLWMSWLGPLNPGFVLLLAIGVAVGTLVGAVRRSDAS